MHPWTPDHPLASRVLHEPRAFEFFQLLHLIERLIPDRPATGEHGPPAREPVRLRPCLDLVFPSADLDRADWRETLAGDGQLRLTTTFFGLYGSDSPLPTHFTEKLLQGVEEDGRVRDFVDLFHHRVLSLFYRVWKKYRYYVVFRPKGDDPISQAVRGLLGIATPDTAERLGVPPVRLFRYAGLFTQRPRSAVGLEGLLQDYFGDTPVEIEQCVGRWLPIETSDQNRFGAANCTLGENMLLGERIFDRSGKIRLKIGPVGYEQFVQFLPNGTQTAPLRQIVRFYCSDPLEFDVQVTLHGDQVPELALGSARPAMLGWTSWGKSLPSGDKSVVFNLPRESRT
jgi:type VI secretion system protein ImpH